MHLADQREVERFTGCTTATGVTIRTGAKLTTAPLRELETITGDLVIGPTLRLDDVALIELREVGGTIQVASNAALRGLLLPRLERAGRIEIEANAGLATVSMPRLVSVGGSLILAGNGSLEIVDLSSLTAVGKDLVITDHPKLTLIEAGNLARVVEIRVERNRALPPEQIDALRAKPAPD